MTDQTREQKIDEVLGKALRDRDFRELLTRDPAAAAVECGLSVEEMNMIAGGLAIGDSLLNPQTVAWCTGKTCNETGKRNIYQNPAQRVTNPAYKPGMNPATKPNIAKPAVRQEADESAQVEASADKVLEPAE
jgi:hypothetical protein